MHEFLADYRGQSFCIYGCKMWALKCARGLKELSTVMEVTVRGMDATVEPIGTYSRRVTGMAVLNSLMIKFHNKSNG